MDELSAKLSAAVPTRLRLRERARPIISAVHVGAGAGWGAVVFMSAYGTLHALQDAGCQLALVSLLSPIPLFAVFLASGSLALGAFATSAVCHANEKVRLLSLPRALAFASLLFTLEMLCFP